MGVGVFLWARHPCKPRPGETERDSDLYQVQRWGNRLLLGENRLLAALLKCKTQASFCT